MADRKYENREGGLWHREGGYMVPSDEPLCTLRGKDPDAIFALRAYIVRCHDVYMATGDNMALAHMEGAQITLSEFEKFQAEHPDRVRRGCHVCDENSEYVTLDEVLGRGRHQGDSGVDLGNC